MPQLGGGENTAPSRREVSAYANTPPGNLRNVLLLLVGAFILRNMFFRDYRSDEISLLRDGGLSTEEIERLVPETVKERRQKANDQKEEFLQMKEDVDSLKKQVKALTEVVNSTGSGHLLRKAMDSAKTGVS